MKTGNNAEKLLNIAIERVAELGMQKDILLKKLHIQVDENKIKITHNNEEISKMHGTILYRTLFSSIVRNDDSFKSIEIQLSDGTAQTN